MFIWVSMDPVTNEITPYDSINSRYLELTYQTSESVNLLINQIELIVTVYFNENGCHVQKTLNGGGERMVRRANSENKVNFNDIIYDMNPHWAVDFYRAAWIHLDPVTGEYGFYSKENSFLLEHALREKKTKQNISITLPHTTINAFVNLDNPINNDIYTQHTDVGLRQIKRVVLKNNSDTQYINIYITPNDGTIDGNRYRFTSENNIFHITNEIIYNDDNFMKEETLPSNLFAKLNDLELMIKQLGFNNDDLLIIAKQLKNEPYRLATKCIIECYNNQLYIHDIMTIVINLWVEYNYLTKNEHGVCNLNESLFENLNELYENNIFRIIDTTEFTRMSLSNYNAKKAIASVLYLLSNGAV